MKKLSLAVLVTAMLGQVASGMMARPEIPVFRAKLVEVDNDDVIALSRVWLTMNKRSALGTPSSFTFEERTPVNCIALEGHRCPPFMTTFKQFPISEVWTDQCGSIHYTAIERRFGRREPQPMIMTPPAKLEVVDHRARFCEDYRKYMWDVELSQYYGDAVETRSFGGNPKPVVSIH